MCSYYDKKWTTDNNNKINYPSKYLRLNLWFITENADKIYLKWFQTLMDDYGKF